MGEVRWAVDIFVFEATKIELWFYLYLTLLPHVKDGEQEDVTWQECIYFFFIFK